MLTSRSKLIFTTITCLVLIVVTDNYLNHRLDIALKQLGSYYQLPDDTIQPLEMYIQYIENCKRNGDKVIVFIGDSTIHTGKIPFSFENKLSEKGVKVFDLSQDGFGDVEKYLILERVAPIVDVVYLNILHSTGYLGNNAPWYKWIETPSLLKRNLTHIEEKLIAGQQLSKEEKIQLRNEISGHVKSTISFEERLSEFLKSKWVLYGKKPLLEQIIFESSPQNWVYNAANGDKQKQNIIKFWTNIKNFASATAPTTSKFIPNNNSENEKNKVEIIENLSEVESNKIIGWAKHELKDMPIIDQENSNTYAWFRKMNGVMQNNPDTKYVVFMNPYNTDVVNHFGLLNWSIYESNTETLKNLFNSKNILFLDYNNKEIDLTSTLFADTHHLGEKGGAIFAERLLKDTREFILEVNK
ncbi:hypothetical protein LJR153_006052 [Paenibacillus sp. LjRoot153]|uniref:hypothetical protein n=1 Tax=Paenibacillus sp. LjRoot153 TaxID=3342270 RepID=UPI003ECE55C1